MIHKIDFYIPLKMSNSLTILEKILDNFLKNKEKLFLLTGKAGSGKTTSISNFLLRSGISPDDIAILTPTHKAKQVIRKKTNNVFQYYTIHKFLGYSRSVDETGKIRFKISKTFDDNKIPKIIAIDECSMINKYSFFKLIDKINSIKAKAIFMGDDNQLPPIGEEMSVSFDIENYYHLHESLRNNGQVYNLCEYIIDNLDEDVLDIKQFDNENDVNIYGNIIEYTDELLDHKDKDYKILCWTNARCQAMNLLMRKKIYGYDADKFCKNERLIVTNYFQSPGGEPYPSNSEFIVDEVTKDKIDLKTLEFIPSKFIPNDITHLDVYTLQIQDDDKIMSVLDKDKDKVKMILDNIKLEALKMNMNNRKIDAILLWELYYTVKDTLTPPIDYSYAITVHRSQGSEWDFIFVDMKDIYKNTNIIERNKLFYVAFTRTMKKLFLNYG